VTAASVVVAEPPQVLRLRSRKAVVSLILAILGFLLGWVLAFLVLTPLAIVLAIRALVDIRRGRAIKGKVIAWFAIALAVITPVLWFLIYLAALSGGAAAGGALGLD
jgi:Domain of unknown function (DUF4190)